MKKKRTITTRIERHLYKVKYKQLNGQWSIYHIARFYDWQSIPRQQRLSDDLPTARRELKDLLSHNLHCKMLGKAFDADAKAANAAEQEAAQREQEQKNRLTIAAWLPLCRKLPELNFVHKKGKRQGQPRAKSTLAADKIGHDHLSRLMGHVHLDRLGRKELKAYVAARRKEWIMRGGEPHIGHRVSDGTIRNELSGLSLALRLAKEYGQQYIEATRDEDSSKKELAALVSESGLKASTLAALKIVAMASPNPKFSAEKPSAGKRERTLDEAEFTRYFAAAKNDEVCPPWFYRMAMLANLTALDESSLLALTEDQIDRQRGEIHVVRAKTGESHHAPLVPEALALIDDQLKENATEKIRPAARRGERHVFVRWDTGKPWTRSSVQYQHRTVCKAARIEGFWFRDFRHQAASRWAQSKDLTAAQWCKAMGWGLSGGMLGTYVQMKSGSVGEAFKK